MFLSSRISSQTDSCVCWNTILFYFIISLKYRQVTLLYHFQVYSKVIQQYMYIHVTENNCNSAGVRIIKISLHALGLHGLSPNSVLACFCFSTEQVSSPPKWG